MPEGENKLNNLYEDLEESPEEATDDTVAEKTLEAFDAGDLEGLEIDDEGEEESVDAAFDDNEFEAI